MSLPIAKKVFVLAVITIGLAACSEMKKVDEMKDNTSEMNQTTKTLLDKTGEMKDGLDKMAGTTDKMANTTDDLRSLTKEELLVRFDQMNETTNSLVDKMRQGDTASLRRETLDKIVRKTTLQGRLADAGIYLMAFEFQVLGQTGEDHNPRFRETLYQQAMLEFFLTIDELAPLGGEVDPSALPNTEEIASVQNKTSAFNAIAFSLHKTNRQQVIDPAYGKAMSVYDLIMVALAMKPEIESGRIVLPKGPHFIKEILARPVRVRQLLQTRYNMFTYGLLGITTNLCEYGQIKQGWKLLTGLSLDLTEKTQGPATMGYLYDEIMEPAARTATDMTRVGIFPQMTLLTRTINSWVSIKFQDRNKSTAVTLEGAGREVELETLWRTYQKPLQKVSFRER